LAAFDAALQDAGVANFNLLPLSSVLPPGSVVLQEPFPVRGDDWGRRLYVVMAEQRETARDREAWAAVGWVQQADGRGLLVEHYGDSREAVEAAVHASLADMVERRPGSWSEPHMVISGIRCEGRPVCALVVAAYETAEWGPGR
jgi:arginine decarboxylase